MSKIACIKNFIKRKRCKHPMINEYHQGGYCPDCGQKINIKWQTVRCGNCDMLLMQKVKKGKISALKNYCNYCGSAKWYVKSDYNKISINERFYAHYIKEIDNENIINMNRNKTEVWVDKAD